MNAKIIVNPASGLRTVQKNAQKIATKLLEDKTLERAEIIRTGKKDDAYNEALNINQKETDIIIVAGGDGTVNEVINGIIDGNKKTPLAILPAGTANDFAGYIKMPQDVNRFCKLIRNHRISEIDLGKTGNKYFINVASGGLLTDIAHNVSSKRKSVLGYMAYIVEGARELTSSADMKSFNVKIETRGRTIEDEILFFLVSNSPRVGGFRKVFPHACISDGLLDVMIVHKQNLKDMVNLFILLNNGKHVESDRVSYFQTDEIRIECSKEDKIELDIDGEKGDYLPARIQVSPKSLNLIVPENFKG